jgi:hypothetical protein
MNDYVSLVDNIHDATNQVVPSIDNLKSYADAVANECESYVKLIPDFFSSHGEAESIKQMYRKLKELDYTRNRVICVVDIPNVSSIYRDYFDGMVRFINDFISKMTDNTPSANLSNMNESMDLAKKADSEFVASLFGGKNGECTDTELTEAVSNVEYLIDFMDHMKDMTNAVKCIFEKSENLISLNNERNTCELNARVLDCVTLVSKSLGDYCNKLIKEIFRTYLQIMDTLNNTVKSVSTPKGLQIF